MGSVIPHLFSYVKMPKNCPSDFQYEEITKYVSCLLSVVPVCYNVLFYYYHMVYELLLYWWHIVLRWQSSGIWHRIVRSWAQWNISMMKPLGWQHCICVDQISSHWNMLTVSEWYLQKCTMREKDKLTIFTVLKSSEFFLCSPF